MEPKINIENQYFSIQDLENGIDYLIPISKRTQARYRKIGLLPYIKIGRRIFYSQRHIEHLFKSLEVQTSKIKAE